LKILIWKKMYVKTSSEHFFLLQIGFGKNFIAKNQNDFLSKFWAFLTIYWD
jgi:hypothetical protein